MKTETVTYNISSRNGVSYISLPELLSNGTKHFFTTKNPNGNNPIPLDIREKFVMVRQVHGDDILVIDKPADDADALIRDARLHPSDAIITNQRNIGIGVVTADCLPVLLYDPVQSVIAAIHAGWRGTVKGIVSKVISRMSDLFNCRAEDIIAGMGPAIGPCCYIVGKAVIDPLKTVSREWERYLKPAEGGKAMFDLAAFNIQQAKDQGISAEKIFTTGLCTACNKEMFHSYRRDGIGTGRMISGIVMRDE